MAVTAVFSLQVNHNQQQDWIAWSCEHPTHVWSVSQCCVVVVFVCVFLLLVVFLLFFGVGGGLGEGGLLLGFLLMGWSMSKYF